MASLTTILQQLHAPGNPSFDDRILLSILLCLSAGERNLVLRLGGESESLSAGEKRDWVQRVGAEVAWICGTVFELTTHRVPCSTGVSPTRFLRELFMPTSIPVPSSSSRSDPTASNGNGNGYGEEGGKKGGGKGRSNSVSFETLASTVAPLQRSPTTSTFSRDSSARRGSILGLASMPLTYEPTSIDNGDSSAGEDLYPFRPLTTRSSSPERRRKSGRRHTINAIAANKRNDSNSFSTTPEGATLELPSPARLVARSATIRETDDRAVPSTIRNRRATVSAGRPVLLPPSSAPPSRLVRRASSPPPVTVMLPSPTTSSTPRTPIDSQPQSFKSIPSTPSVRRSPRDALRRLSSITTTTATTDGSPKILPQCLILERLDKTRPSVQQALLDTLRERRIHLAASTTGKRGGSVTVDEGASARTKRIEGALEGVRGWEGNFILPKGFFIVAIVCADDPTEGTDTTWGGISRYLLDHFTLSHSIPLSTLSLLPPSYPLPLPHPLSTPLPSSPLDRTSLPPLHPNLSNFLSDTLSTLRSHAHLEARMLTARACSDLSLVVRIWVRLSRGDGALVLPRDVVGVCLGVLGHRLRVRRGRDEKSVFWGSTAGEEWRDGVEGVVREVVGKV